MYAFKEKDLILQHTSKTKHGDGFGNQFSLMVQLLTELIDGSRIERKTNSSSYLHYIFTH